MQAVRELITGAPDRVLKILIEGDRHEDLVELAVAAGLTTERVDRDVMESWVGEGIARGVLGIASSPLRPDLESVLDVAADGPRTRPAGRELLVALDGVVDPMNLGAILRSAEFFGAAGAFWARDRAAPLSALAVRASAGASERLPLAAVTNLSRALDQAKEAGYWVVGTVVDHGASLHDLLASDGVPDRVVLVLGSEHKGLRRLTRERCDLLVCIDGGGELGSLNVAAAAAAVLALLA